MGGVGVSGHSILVILNPMRLSKERTWSRWTAITLAVLLTVVNQYTIILVIRELLSGDILRMCVAPEDVPGVVAHMRDGFQGD